MKIRTILMGSFVILNLAACSSPQDKAANAQAEYTEEKTETLKQYKECVNDSGGDQTKMARCEALLNR
ncbi:hypothetical protein MNBD_GAMMA21-1862 [hydrothermal vent metagenome]|uniref:Uncharacterized protein n=1 Tax=hydrothermal vent metagenome TaxID=652676 RepID=A0A3B1A5U9_9ZZZZ